MKVLKIKDSVDLKELEKFKFKKYRYYSNNANYYSRGRTYIDEAKKIIEIPTKNDRYNVEEYVQDLIKLNIVEVIEM